VPPTALQMLSSVCGVYILADKSDHTQQLNLSSVPINALPIKSACSVLAVDMTDPCFRLIIVLRGRWVVVLLHNWEVLTSSLDSETGCHG
jgi:hypothetical protein